MCFVREEDGDGETETVHMMTYYIMMRRTAKIGVWVSAYKSHRLMKTKSWKISM